MRISNLFKQHEKISSPILSAEEVTQALNNLSTRGDYISETARKFLSAREKANSEQKDNVEKLAYVFILAARTDLQKRHPKIQEAVENITKLVIKASEMELNQVMRR